MRTLLSTWYHVCVVDYMNCRGVSGRGMYWRWFFFMFCAGIVWRLLEIGFFYENIAYAMGVRFWGLVWGAFFFLPSMALTVRRLRDVGWSGAWAFSFVPLYSLFFGVSIHSGAILLGIFLSSMHEAYVSLLFFMGLFVLSLSFILSSFFSIIFCLRGRQG